VLNCYSFDGVWPLGHGNRLASLDQAALDDRTCFRTWSVKERIRL